MTVEPFVVLLLDSPLAIVIRFVFQFSSILYEDQLEVRWPNIDFLLVNYFLLTHTQQVLEVF